MNPFVKAFLVWCLIALVEVAHGIARAKLLAPRIGDLRSRQIGIFTGSIIILLITRITIRWIAPPNEQEALAMGVMWAVCMFVFEMLLGRYVFRFSWKWLLQDFNFFKGRLMALGMVVLALAPWLMLRLR